MDNNIIDKQRNYTFLNTSQFTNRTAILNDAEIPKRVLVIEHYLDNPEERRNLETKIIKGLNEYDKLVSQRELLLEALKEIMLWGKIKDGKFTYTTSDERVNELKELIKKCEPLT